MFRSTGLTNADVNVQIGKAASQSNIARLLYWLLNRELKMIEELLKRGGDGERLFSDHDDQPSKTQAYPITTSQLYEDEIIH